MREGVRSTHGPTFEDVNRAARSIGQRPDSANPGHRHQPATDRIFLGEWRTWRSKSADSRRSADRTRSMGSVAASCTGLPAAGAHCLRRADRLGRTRAAAGRLDPGRAPGGAGGADGVGSAGTMARPGRGSDSRPIRSDPGPADRGSDGPSVAGAAVQRNLDLLVRRGLVREVMGQGRFRVWAARV